MALIELSVVEQRYRAVLAVEAGAKVVEVAQEWGVSRQSVHSWLARYRRDGLAGLVDRSHRPATCPHQAPAAVEARVCELRRGHPRWGPKRLAYEVSQRGMAAPSPSTVYRILVRHGLIEPTRRRRSKADYKRWERELPMALWQLDLVGGIFVRDRRGDPVEAKIVTGLDDHSRFNVIAAVVPRATGRAVCLAFAGALRRFGIPDEVLTDNGKQFTARFSRHGGEVLFDRICRDNGIAHRLTQPASPTTTGKIERFHLTLRREFLDDAGVFDTVAAAQAALDGWVHDYNEQRPHQALDMATPATRFAAARPVPGGEDLLPLRLPATLELVAGEPPAAPTTNTAGRAADGATIAGGWAGGPIEFERVVPASGNMAVAGKQFWVGPLRAGLTVTVWADSTIIHLLVAGIRIKSVRSHLSPADLTALVARGARPAGPAPLPDPEHSDAIEVDRVVNPAGCVGLGGRPLLAGDRLAGTRVSIRVEPATLTFFDPDTRIVLRTRVNPLTRDQIRRLRGARPAGPPPRPATDPITVQRHASATGVIVVTGQRIALGRVHAGRDVVVHVAATTLTIEAGADVRTVNRTTTKPVVQVKGTRPRPRKVPYVS